MKLTLASLIRERQDNTGDSYATIAHRGGLSKAKVGQLAAHDMPHMPRPDTLEKLARGLEVPLRVVQLAAMNTAGVSPDHEEPADTMAPLLAKLEQLTEDDYETVEIFVTALHNHRNTRGQG